MKTFLKKHTLSLVFALLTVAVMIIIFCFSHQQGKESAETSSNVLIFLVNIFNKNFKYLSETAQQQILLQYSLFIRKAAHFSVFGTLGFFSNIAVRRYFAEKSASLPRFSLILNALFCFVYACSDEFHQSFIEGRASCFTDILIDFSGSLTALLVIAVFICICKKTKRKIVFDKK